MVRRSVYLGAGGYDLTAAGSLVYLPGVNAEVGNLVQRTHDGRMTILNVPAAAHLRFTPSPDGRRIATVVEGVRQQELRVYDLSSGGAQAIDQGFYISAPSWSPDGTRLVYRVDGEPGNERLIVRRLDSPEAPRELLAGGGSQVTQPSSWLADDFLLVGAGTNAAEAMLLDPTASPVRVDSLGFSSFFTSISPDRRWIAIQNQGAAGIRLQPWPARDRVYQVDAVGIEPRWRSATELAFQLPGASAIHQVTVTPASGSPVGARRPLVEDRRFVDTPGWSFAFTGTGDLIYLRSPASDEGHYLRVVPNWVDQMKRAVDEANR
jgi:dipeptidyl aminopeptidase/acylaminoacyl peptidase